MKRSVSLLHVDKKTARFTSEPIEIPATTYVDAKTTYDVTVNITNKIWVESGKPTALIVEVDYTA